MKCQRRAFLALLVGSAVRAQKPLGETTIRTDVLTVRVVYERFRFSISGVGGVVRANSASGLLLGSPDTPKPACVRSVLEHKRGYARFAIATAEGLTAHVDVSIRANTVEFVVVPGQPCAVLLRSAGASPGFGLGDHAVVDRKSFNTDITGYVNNCFLSGQGVARMVSNLAIYPKDSFAVLVWDPHEKIVRSTLSEVTQGVRRAYGPVKTTYFLGSPHDIYGAYLRARNSSPYPVLLPKYSLFGVGWEAFGALGWGTKQQTIVESVDRYLLLGYPIQWLVLGSGFWPQSENKYEATTSFGMYDPNLYPDPKALIQHFHRRGIKFMQGPRIAFITDGPFSAEGMSKRFFIQDDGRPRIFRIGFPKSPCYLLDAQNPEAVAWYGSLVEKWLSYGVDGFKEDLFGFGSYNLREDKVDPTDQTLM